MAYVAMYQDNMKIFFYSPLRPNSDIIKPLTCFRNNHGGLFALCITLLWHWKKLIVLLSKISVKKTESSFPTVKKFSVKTSRKTPGINGLKEAICDTLFEINFLLLNLLNGKNRRGTLVIVSFPHKLCQIRQ